MWAPRRARVLGDVAGLDRWRASCLGTGGFVVVPTGRTPRHVDGLLTTLLYEDAEGPVYAVEGTVHGLVAGIVEAGTARRMGGAPPERIAARAGGAKRAPRVDAALEGTGTPIGDRRRRLEVEPGDSTPAEIVRGTIDDLAARFGRIARAAARRRGCARRGSSRPAGSRFAPHLTSRISEAMGAPIRRGSTSPPHRRRGGRSCPRWPLTPSIPPPPAAARADLALVPAREARPPLAPHRGPLRHLGLGGDAPANDGRRR